jgi:glycosyltransferase involved in cell wall biosynthesis
MNNHVLMLSLDSSLAARQEGDAFQRHRAYGMRWGERHPGGWLTIITYTRADNLQPIRQDNLTILPTNSRRAPLFPLDAMRLGEQAEKPVGLIVAQDPFTTGLAGLWLRARLGAPLLVQNHSYFFGNPEWVKEHPVRNRALLAMGRVVRAQADFYRAVNNEECSAYLRAGGKPERAVMLPLGTASERFAALPDPDALARKRADLGILPDDRVILWVGYPVAFKRVPLLFEAFKRALKVEPRARLVLIGDMARAPVDLAALASDMGIADRVRLHGPVLHADLPLYYALGHVYAHTSSYEGMPRVLFEASAAGLPLVGMDAVGVRDVIEDGVNGYLVSHGDTEAMAARLVTLLGDPETARRLGGAAREKALSRFHASRTLESWLDVWDRAIALGMRTHG